MNSPNAMRMMRLLHEAHQAPPEAAPVRKVIKKTRPPTPSESESESESSSGYSSYDEPAMIYKKVVEDAQCEYVSPTGLAQHKTTKDMIKHLHQKGCPELPNLKKNVSAKKMDSPKAPKPRAKKTAPEAPAVVLAPGEATKVVLKKSAKVTPAEPVAAAPPAPAAPAPAPAKAGKTKRAPTAYAKFVGEKMKAGGSMKEAAAAWKAQKAA